MSPPELFVLDFIKQGFIKQSLDGPFKVPFLEVEEEVRLFLVSKSSNSEIHSKQGK